jgi:hypothetical protein
LLLRFNAQQEISFFLVKREKSVENKYNPVFGFKKLSGYLMAEKYPKFQPKTSQAH